MNNIFAIRKEKNTYVQTKNLPEPKKITRAALGLLGTFSMSGLKSPALLTHISDISVCQRGQDLGLRIAGILVQGGANSV